jgi:hypothetical protein
VGGGGGVWPPPSAYQPLVVPPDHHSWRKVRGMGVRGNGVWADYSALTGHLPFPFFLRVLKRGRIVRPLRKAVPSILRVRELGMADTGKPREAGEEGGGMGRVRGRVAREGGILSAPPLSLIPFLEQTPPPPKNSFKRGHAFSPSPN